MLAGLKPFQPSSCFPSPVSSYPQADIPLPSGFSLSGLLPAFPLILPTRLLFLCHLSTFHLSSNGSFPRCHHSLSPHTDLRDVLPAALALRTWGLLHLLDPTFWRTGRHPAILAILPSVCVWLSCVTTERELLWAG